LESRSVCSSALSQIHILHELESSLKLFSLTTQKNTRNSSDLSIKGKEEMILNTWKWNERYAFSSDDLSHRLQLLAVRRFIFAKHSVLNLLGENWMQSYSALLQENYLESAKYSLHQLKNLSTMNPEMLLIKESQLLSKKNEISQAITLLEPKFINIPYVIKLLKFDKKKSSLKSSKSRAKFLEELLGNDRNEEKFHKLYELFIQNESFFTRGKVVFKYSVND
jgi:hypothetical protein